MDINDERRKKLEAGKEKLAAFRKKKAKSKKSAKDNGENLSAIEVEPFNGDVNSPSSDVVKDSVQGQQDENSEESRAQVPIECQLSFPQLQETSVAKDSGEENSITPKPTVREMKHDHFEENTNTNSHHEPKMDRHGESGPGLYQEATDIQQALAQRDKLIGQLTHSLKSNADQQAEKEELVSQVLTLAQQVTQLQAQLKEADETLQEQLQFHGISGQALQSAKTQMLQLQSIVHEKDKELALATQQLEKNHESLDCSKEENAKLLQKLEEREEELSHLQQCYDSTISSHEEKQEKEESEKSHQLVELQHRWKERERDMNETLGNQAKEIDTLRRSEEEWKERESELKQNYETLVNSLQTEEAGKQERLKTLEFELEELRSQNEKMVKEANVLKEESELKNSSLSKLESLAQEHSQLLSMHSNVVDDCVLLKSQNSGLECSLKQLELENETLRSELETLSSKLENEIEKLNSAHGQQGELESKHILDCDRLNNKINELQGNLSSTQESFTALEEAFANEKEFAEVLQKEILAKESSCNDISQKLTSATLRNSELQSELQLKEDQLRELENILQERVDAEETIKNKDIGIQEEKIKLEERLDDMTIDLNKLRGECDNYIKQISHLQMEGMSYMDKVDNLNNELEKKCESLDLENRRCKGLEDQLQIIEDERGILNDNIKSLNDEIHALKDDLKDERMQKDIIGEELISTNSKLVDNQNLTQHKNSEHKKLVEQYRSDIDKLQSEVENFTALDSKFKSSAIELDKLSAELKLTRESLQIKTEDFETLKSEMGTLREGERKSASDVKDLENELTHMRQKLQEVVDQKDESLQSQEEMQCQLQTTVNQWQKLQLIVQEKEIELHSLHDDLDEQKRICNTMKRTHEEYLDSIRADGDELRREKEDKEARIIELEGMLANLHESLAAKEVELSDTMTKVETADTSSQNLATHLTEKEKELDLVSYDKEKLSAELSDKIRDIEHLESDLRRINNEKLHMTDELKTSRDEKTKMKTDIEERDSLLKSLESKLHDISVKETESASRVVSLEGQLADAQICFNDTLSENTNLKSLVAELERACVEKDKLLSDEALYKKEIQKHLDKEKQQCNQLRGALSSLSQDIELKEELLLTSSTALEEEKARMSQKDQELLKGVEEVQRLNEELSKVKEELKTMEAELAKTGNDQELIVEKLQEKDTELDQMKKKEEELDSIVESLQGKLKEMETNSEKLFEERDHLNAQLICAQDNLTDKEKLLSDKEKLLSEEQEKSQLLTEELDAEIQQLLCLKGELSSLSIDVQGKENSLVHQSLLLQDKMATLSSLEMEIIEREQAMKELKEENANQIIRIEELASKELSLETEVSGLKEQIFKYEQDLVKISLTNEELTEHQTQLEQEVKTQAGIVIDLKRDTEILQRESSESRIDLEEKENQKLSLMQEVDFLKATVATSNEEKEMLKSNFDSCLEEMHQKSSAQEIEIGHLKSKLAEECRNRDFGQEEIKEMYTQQLAEMEDKLLELEREKNQVEKEIYARDLKLERLKDDYEQQISETESSLLLSHSEVTKLKDSISKINADHDNELTDLKSLHELQMSELMDNYLTLEKSMSEVQKNLTDQAECMKQERNEMEQSFENLMSEMDEKKRRSDSDINRLRKQLDELLKDQEKEIKSVEKKYETQMFDLEDRCSVMSSELERVRKSVVGVEGDFADERSYLEGKIEELEDTRRNLEIKCTILEDDIVLLKEHSNTRENEVKSILKTAAEKQSELKYEVEDLEEKLRVIRMDNELSSTSMKKELEQKIEDVNAENEHLKNRLKTFEVNAQMDLEMKGHEDEEDRDESIRSKLVEMKSQLAALTDENFSLKRRLLGHKSLEKKARLLSTGVEGICPPPEEPKEEEIIIPSQMRMITSTPSKKNIEDDVPFSPTAEEVSLIEGFVSETRDKPVSAHCFEKITFQQSTEGEPDFVAEEEDRFHPEMVIEKAVADFIGGEPTGSVHPIQENEITEGFQPENSDQFFVEISEECSVSWPLQLSVGMSPTSVKDQHGFFDEKDGPEQAITNVLPQQADELGYGGEEKVKVEELVEKRVKQMKEDLEEDYAAKLRKQKQDLIIEYESNNEKFEKELEQHFAHKEQSVKHDWELKFAKAVKKMKKDFEKKLQKQLANQEGTPQKNESLVYNQEQVPGNHEESDWMSDVDGGGEGFGDVVEQLSKENQELAEVRDELLKEIELSQARGRHNRVQHELQSMLSEREKENDPASQEIILCSENDAVVDSDVCQSEVATPCTSRPNVSISVDVQTSSSQITEPAERSPTVAAERILEELEDITQQSSQDLPLEWELTNIIPVETGVSLESASGQHQSVWEVFGSRCERQDCLELDTLRSQYESQLSALQGQLEDARRHNQHSMEASHNNNDELLSRFREKLDGDQKDLLDQLVTKLEDKYQHNVSLEVMAVKTALEQVYHSKSQLEVSAAEVKHQEEMKEMKARMEKDYKEMINNTMAGPTKGIVDSSLTDKCNNLIQRINQTLDDKVMAPIEEKMSDVDTPRENDGSLSQEIRNLLTSQREEISCLRSQLLGDYESVLQSRTQSVIEQTQEVADLEKQLKSLQTQYSDQVASFQELLASRDDEQKKLSEEERSKYEEQQLDLKSHYEKRVQEMEACFEKEINCIKEKYEEQISGLVQARLGLHNDLGSESNDLKEPITADTDSDNADTPRTSVTDTVMRINELEQELKERDSQIQELKACLDFNGDGFKKRVDDLEEELQAAKAMCVQLEELVEENKHVIETLEQEKKESEKLYKDLLEKESPRSKGSATRGYTSGESVDDSFSSAREEIQDTPRSFDSTDTPAEAQKVSTEIVNSEEDKDDEHNSTIPFANDSVESELIPDSNNCNNNNNNSNNNNDNRSLQSSLEEQISSLEEHVESLNQQLEEMKVVEKKLQSRIEENQHGHLEMMENLRQELEHEKQVEVETLQSEFKVQLDVELKRKAAEMTNTQESSSSSSLCSVEKETQTHQSDIDISDKLYSTLETADDDILEASSSNMFLQTANFELKTVVMANVSAKEDDAVNENMSDDSKATSNLSPFSSPTHSSALLTQSVPLTDVEKEAQTLKDEYEAKVTRLTSEVERLNEESRSMATTHQQQMQQLETQLNETEARYDRLMEGVQSGDHPELNDLMKDKYDQELDLTKSLMQKDFDEMLKEEKKKFMEHHRKLMGDFMEDKTTEDEKTEQKHKEELEKLKERLESDFEVRCRDYEQEIERLNRDLDLLRETTPRGSEEGTLDSTLPEIEEITLTSQELNSASPGSEISTESSTPLKSQGMSYEESEEETEAEKVSTLQVRDFSHAVEAPSPSPSLSKEKEQLELKVQQLTAQVERLTQQLVEKPDSPPVSPLHSPHNATLKAEDPALISMLQSDLDRMDAERESVQNTNDRLLGLLSDTVKTYVHVEDNINRKLKQVVSGGTPRPQSQQSHQSQGGDSGDGASSRAASVELGLRHGPGGDSHSRQGSPADFLKGASPDADTSHDSHALDNTSILSNATDEGLEISLRLAESIFVGPDLDAEGEEILSDARGRLTSAVDRLLELMEQSMSQLHEAKSTQEDLLSTLATRARDVEASQSRGSELNSQLAAEIEAKEYLGLELHKAEGLIAGFVADREANSKQVQTLEEQREALIVELDLTRSRLEDFQRSQSEIDAVREELTHQQTLLRENVGQETQALLNEVSNLNQERRELATQLQHQLDLSRKRLSEMEALAEEAERNHETVVEEKNQALEDLGLQLDNTERQLKSSKAFVDELLVEREMEREEHQKEIDKMKAVIEGKDRSATSQDRMQREIADLTEQLQSRIATQSALHQRIVDLQKVLEDKELGTNDLKIWVSQLEGELDQKFNEEDQLKDRISKLERQLTEKSDTNEDELEDTVKAFTPRSEYESGDSVTAPSPVNLGHRNSVVSLEEELLRSKETKEELDQENNTLKEQLHDQMLQISGLKNQIDQMRHYASLDDSDAAQLRERLAQERDQVEKKEAEIAEAERKIENLESVLQTKQLEAEEMSSRVSRILEMGNTQEENERLRNDLQDLRSQMSEMASSSSSSQLFMPASLLEEKNEEIMEIRTRLQVMEADMEGKTGQVAMHEEKILHLQQKLKDRDEEIVDLQDSLASARRGEACLDMSLPMSEEVNSMLNISMTGRTSIQQEFEDTMAQREGEVQSLELQIATLKKDLDEAEAKLSEKTEEEEKWKTELSEKDEEIQKLQQDLLTVAKESDEMKSSLESLKTEKGNQTDQQKLVDSLQNTIHDKDNEIYEMTLEIQELKTQVEEAAQATEAMEKVIEQRDADLIKAQEERDEKRDQLQEKEHTLDQMIIQIDGLQTEISGLTNFQTELQKDYDTIQSMLDEKEKVLETLTQELTDTKSHQDALESMGNVQGDADGKLKQALNDLETEKQVCSELRESLKKEEENAEKLKEQLKQTSKECDSLKETLENAEKALGEKDAVIGSQEEEITLAANKEETVKEKVILLEKTLKEDNDSAKEEMKVVIDEYEKIRTEYISKIKDLEEQLQMQDANYVAMCVANDKDLNQSSESESSKLQHEQVKEKDAIIDDLKHRLENQERDAAELVNVKRQLEEMDEQLRSRQSMLLTLQAECERLSEKSTSDHTGDIFKQLEEKDLQLNELEGQLRFRQSALLELEAERDRLIEEKAKVEQQLRKEIEEKVKALQEIQAKYTNLKDGINEEVLHLEQEMQKSNQTRTTEKPDQENSKEINTLKQKLILSSEELKAKTSKVEDIETELQRKNNELEVRQNTIHDLLEEIESLQLDRAVLEAKEKELENLRSIINEADQKTSEGTAMDEENIKKMLINKVEEKGAEMTGDDNVCLEMDVVCAQSTTSLNTAPVLNDGIDGAAATQTIGQVQHQQLLDELHLDIQEKEKNIDNLTSEIEGLKSQIEEQDRVILSLKDELEISNASHEKQLSSRDNQIGELQEAVRKFAPATSLEKLQQSSESSALSPKTKEQISHLKTELRKAHKALEEMEHGGSHSTKDTEDEATDFVDSGRFTHQAELEALRKIAQEQEEELVLLKSHANNPVMEEMIEAEKVQSVQSQGSRNSRGSNIDEFSFASNRSNTDDVPPRIQALLDRLQGLGEDLLSASDFEYLQRHLFQRPTEDDSDTSAWSKERAALMDTIIAVKDLLQQADRLAAKSVDELSESGDWRSELLDSLIQVYQGEKQILRAEVGTANNAYPEMDIVLQLESRIHDLEQVHQRGLDEMLKADRQSLLDEVDNLHHRLLEAKAQLEETRHTLDQRIAEIEKAKSSAEWKLERQIQMLEYKIQQEGVIQEDLKKSLNLERQRVSELNSQSSHDRSKTYELQSELSSTQIQLSKVRDALEREQHRFNSVTDALEEEQAKTGHLTEMLDSTKKKLKALKDEVAQHQAALDSEAILEDLKLELERERQKSYEYSEAEEHAQKQLVQLSEKLDTVKKKLAATKEDYEAKIEQLHREWMDRDVHDRKEREMESVTKLTDLLNVERESHRKALENERQTARQLMDALEEVKSENNRLLGLYEMEKSHAEQLEKEEKNSNGMLKHLRTTENEAGQLQEKVLQLEEELSHVQERASALEAELNRSHHNGHMTSQSQPGEYHREALGHLMTASYIDEELKVRLAQCCSRLQMIASKLQDMTGNASSQGQGYTNGDDDVDGGLDESRGLQVVMEELEKLKANIREREEKRQSSLEKDRSAQADQLLQHNKQLAEHVKKLKLEKEQLSGALRKLENNKTKMSLPQYTSDVTSDEEGVYDRTVWASEKLSLQMALDSAEHEIQHLRSELRKFNSLTKADGQLLKLDPDKTQRLYGKYLRAESFRKALIYQKKYLLLLLGGYRDTEQETLAILASMGGFPSPRTRTNNGSASSKPLGTFRSVGRAVIAIFRMKYLVRKWKRATRVGSPVMTGQIASQHAYIPNSSSSYTLPNNRQQQQPSSQLQQQYQHHLHHRNNQRHKNNSSPSLNHTPSAAALVSTAGNASHFPPHHQQHHLPHHPRQSVNSNGGNHSDYVESLTNGGLSSLVYSNNSSRRNPTLSSTAASSFHPSSHQVPSSPPLSSSSSSQRHNQQQQNHQGTTTTANYNTTPPTKDSSKSHHVHKTARGNKDSARRQILQEASDSDSLASRGNVRYQSHSSGNSDDENFMRYLENVQLQLSEGSSPSRRVSWR